MRYYTYKCICYSSISKQKMHNQLNKCLPVVVIVVVVVVEVLVEVAVVKEVINTIIYLVKFHRIKTNMCGQ